MPPKMIKTMTDQELEGLEAKRGPSHTNKDKSFQGGAHLPDTQVTADSIAWGLISSTHPDYDFCYWEECRALYSGGKTLLRNRELMERVFPSHNGEDSAIYAERVKRAHYVPYPGAIIDGIASGLSADPVQLLPSDPDDKSAKISQWWIDFTKDTSRKGADRCSLAHLAVQQVRDAMIAGGVSWALVDLPLAPDTKPASRLDQEKLGLLDPYVTPIPAENVIEWQETNGELDYVIICDTEARRDSVHLSRGNLTKTFTIWSKTDWIKYAIVIDPNKPPKKDTPVGLIGQGKHSFGRVPIVRLRLPEGLRAMDKLESMAREHFNKRCALGWAEYKSLFSLLYEFLASEEGTTTTPISGAQEDPDRALSVKGQGYVNERGHQDRAEYIGPPTAPFAEARESCAEIKREMYRVTHSMADSVEMTSGASRRSGESKAQDGKSKDVILKELGRLIREFVQSLIEMVQVVKGDEDFRVGGADSFDSVDLMAKVNEAVELINGVPMKSPTFLRIYLERVYTMVLAGEVTEAERVAIRSELAMMINVEEMMMGDSVIGGALPPPPPRPTESDDVDDDDDDEPLPKSRPLKSKGVEYKSR